MVNRDILAEMNRTKDCCCLNQVSKCPAFFKQSCMNVLPSGTLIFPLLQAHENYDKNGQTTYLKRRDTTTTGHTRFMEFLIWALKISHHHGFLHIQLLCRPTHLHLPHYFQFYMNYSMSVTSKCPSQSKKRFLHGLSYNTTNVKNIHLHRDSNPFPWNTVPML